MFVCPFDTLVFVVSKSAPVHMFHSKLPGRQWDAAISSVAISFLEALQHFWALIVSGTLTKGIIACMFYACRPPRCTKAVISQVSFVVENLYTWKREIHDGLIAKPQRTTFLLPVLVMIGWSSRNVYSRDLEDPHFLAIWADLTSSQAPVVAWNIWIWTTWT